MKRMRMGMIKEKDRNIIIKKEEEITKILRIGNVILVRMIIPQKVKNVKNANKEEIAIILQYSLKIELIEVIFKIVVYYYNLKIQSNSISNKIFGNVITARIKIHIEAKNAKIAGKGIINKINQETDQKTGFKIIILAIIFKIVVYL